MKALRNCIAKHDYASARAAWKDADKIHRKTSRNLQPYHCPACQRWHLTKAGR